MVWISADRKIIGTVELEEEGGPTPEPIPPATSNVLKNFLAEHLKLRNILKKHGNSGKCVSLELLVKESGIDKPRVQKHVDIFATNDYVVRVEDDDSVCSREAIQTIKGQLQEVLES